MHPERLFGAPLGRLLSLRLLRLRLDSKRNQLDRVGQKRLLLQYHCQYKPRLLLLPALLLYYKLELDHSILQTSLLKLPTLDIEPVFGLVLALNPKYKLP